jgi:hypothetical protein
LGGGTLRLGEAAHGCIGDSDDDDGDGDGDDRIDGHTR